MKFGSTKAGGRLQKANGANPFKELQAQGPGTGMPKDIFTTPMTKRRRWDNQALGDTPPRDGPFAQSAAGIVRQYPPRTRQSQRKKGNGLDPLK